MSENKKSFLLYCDIIHTVKKLSKEQAGELFNIILAYVNDENPIINDLLIELVFEPIKQQLKRDLRSYEQKKQLWSEAGKKSAEARALKKQSENLTDSTDVKNVKVKSTESTVNVNDNVNVNVTVNDIKKNRIAAIASTAERQKVFYNSLIPYLASHPKERIKAFYNYWSEKNKSGTKMKFELERTWEISKRLTTWESREKPTPTTKPPIDEETYKTPAKW